MTGLRESIIGFGAAAMVGVGIGLGASGIMPAAILTLAGAAIYAVWLVCAEW